MEFSHPIRIQILQPRIPDSDFADDVDFSFTLINSFQTAGKNPHESSFPAMNIITRKCFSSILSFFIVNIIVIFCKIHLICSPPSSPGNTSLPLHLQSFLPMLSYYHHHTGGASPQIWGSPPGIFIMDNTNTHTTTNRIRR